MLQSFLNSGLYLLVDAAAFALLAFFTYKGLWKRLPVPTGYLFALLLIDAFARRYVLYHYGIDSGEYRYFYWLTDVALALGAFLLICTFFHRACGRDERMWRFLRLFLVFVFLLVFGITLFSLSRNIERVYTRFIIDFQQNLYFTCLVLNTLLYIMMQQIESTDEELQMLVCGTGLQFAGPAANLALLFITHSQSYAISLYALVNPLCTMGMLLTWFYAVVKMPKPAEARASKKLVPVEVTIRSAA